ncbi:MAG: response regulator [Dehalococcoidia bacterium]
MENQKSLVALEDDLFFTGKIDNAASQLGYRLEVARDAQGLARRVEENRPDLVILDLSMEDVDWGETIRGLKSSSPETPIVAFGPHTEETLLSAASASGCDAVLTKGEFSSELANLIRKYGGDPAR